MTRALERESPGAPALRAANGCPVCGLPADAPFARLQGLPVHTNVLWSSAEEARAAPRGDIALSLCRGCGVIWNTRFDPAVLSYDADYENSLHFSGEFRRYSEELAEQLIDRHPLAGGHVAELGSGKGEFLALLCERAACTGIGFDPSYAGEADGRADGRLTFVRDLLGPDSDLGEADLVVCRHVVEHLEDPVGVLAMVRRAVGERSAAIYVEVPAAEYLLREDAIWDLIYPHVTCLSAGALEEILRRAGFHPRQRGYSFGGQYLWVDATTDASNLARDEPRPEDSLAVDVGEFAERLRSKRELWAEELPRLLSAGPVALWGAGAKGTTFLNLVPAGESIQSVVDLNPRKQGKYVPGTGQRIVAPESLVAVPPATILVMNPVYVDEIAETLHQLGVEAKLRVA